MLIGHGASVSPTDFRGCTALHYAAAHTKQCVDILLEAGNYSVVHCMFFEVYCECVGSEINAKSNAGDTPLHAAVLAGAADVVTCLLQRKASVNVRNRNGSTPHDVACTRLVFISWLLFVKINSLVV